LRNDSILITTMHFKFRINFRSLLFYRKLHPI